MCSKEAELRNLVSSNRISIILEMGGWGRRRFLVTYQVLAGNRCENLPGYI